MNYSFSLKLVIFGTVVAFLVTGAIRLTLNNGNETSPKSMIFPEHIQERINFLRNLSISAGLPETNLSEEVCIDKGCLDAAFDILTTINYSVDPCKDFYQFSCGTWIKNNPGESPTSPKSHFSALSEKISNATVKILNETDDISDPLPLNQARSLFRQCMDLAGREKSGLDVLKQAIDDIGGWQLFNPEEWKADSFDWMKAIAKVNMETDAVALLDISSKQDPMDSDRKIIYIDYPDSPEEDIDDRFEAYQEFIVKVAQELNSTQDEEQLKNEARNIIEFEKKLETLNRKRSDDNYSPYKLKDLQELADAFHSSFNVSWKELLKNYFEPAGIHDISDDDDMNVPALNYVQSPIGLLAEERENGTHVQANYIVWRFVQGSLEWSTERMQNIAKDFRTKKPKEKHLICSEAVNKIFGMAVGGKYIERNFDGNTKKEVENMVEELKDSFDDVVREVSWMTPETKAKAIERKAALGTLTAYPKWVKEKEKVEEYYRGAELMGSYLESQYFLTSYSKNKQLSLLRTPTDRNSWADVVPHTVDGYNILELNMIVLPAGLLQPPVFIGDRPKHQIYSRVGTVIGHEVIHGFDKSGSHHNKIGNLEGWWDNHTLEEYEKKEKCIADQYSKQCYEYENGVRHCNDGAMTSEEDLCDIGGLRQSFLAYKKFLWKNGPEKKLPGLEHFSNEQLFFVGYASMWCHSKSPRESIEEHEDDNHSPAEWRTNGVVRNSADFVQAFNCPVDSEGMNLPATEKCFVW